MVVLRELPYATIQEALWQSHTHHLSWDWGHPTATPSTLTQPDQDSHSTVSDVSIVKIIQSWCNNKRISPAGASKEGPWTKISHSLSPKCLWVLVSCPKCPVPWLVPQVPEPFGFQRVAFHGLLPAAQPAAHWATCTEWVPQQWNHHPWSCSREGWMWHLVPWPGCQGAGQSKVVLNGLGVFSHLNGSVILWIGGLELEPKFSV